MRVGKSHWKWDFPNLGTVVSTRYQQGWCGRVLKVPPKLAAGSRQNSQAGGLRYVAQPSRLRVRGASEPHVPSHRQPTDGGTIKTRPLVQSNQQNIATIWSTE